MMMMGWKADIRRTAILRAATARYKDLDIDTLIFKERDFAPAPARFSFQLRRPHSILGIQIAYDLAQQWGSELEILRIARDNRCDPQRSPSSKKYCEQLAQDTELQLQLLNIDVPVRILPSADVVKAVERQASDRDLVVIGASNDWRQENT